MFKRAIASAVKVPLEFVLKLEVTEVEKGAGSRRLQPIKTKLYEVAYQVLVPSGMDPNDAVEKASRIAQPGTAESQLFRDALMMTDGVARVGKIVATIPAYKVGDESSSPAPSTPKNQEKDDNSWKSLAIGAIAIVLGLSCLAITTAFLIKRKFASSDSGESASSGPEADIEDGRRDLVNDTKIAPGIFVSPREDCINDTNIAPGDLSMNSTPQESSVNSTPQEGVLVDSTAAPTTQAAELAPIAKEGAKGTPQRNTKAPLKGTPHAAKVASIAEEGTSQDPLEGVVVAFPQRRLFEL